MCARAAILSVAAQCRVKDLRQERSPPKIVGQVGGNGDNESYDTKDDGWSLLIGLSVWRRERTMDDPLSVRGWVVYLFEVRFVHRVIVVKVINVENKLVSSVCGRWTTKRK